MRRARCLAGVSTGLAVRSCLRPRARCARTGSGGNAVLGAEGRAGLGDAGEPDDDTTGLGMLLGLGCRGVADGTADDDGAGATTLPGAGRESYMPWYMSMLL